MAGRTQHDEHDEHDAEREAAAEERRGADGAREASIEDLGDVGQLARERDEYRSRWQRAQADFQNLRRRTQGEVEGSVRRALEPLLRNLLLVIDHLDLALATPVESDDGRALAQGVRLTRDQMLQALHQEGVEPIRLEADAEGGQPAFDPALHEAVATVERADLPDNTVVDVLRPGYTWRGQVLRFAQVRVSRRKDAARAGGSEGAQQRSAE